ncbi:MAG: cytochrome ubiquinol oxidase subunit I, partial [Myxococcales bacterium]
RKRKPWEDRRFLKASVLVAPLGLVAIETGWIVTEVGRQPWIIRGVMRTRDAVTPVTGLEASFAMFSLLYLGLGVVVLLLLARYVRASDARDGGTP